MYPDADIFTSVYFMDHPMLAGRRVYTSWLQKIPFLNRRHKLAGILRPWAFRSFDLSGYDLVICSSSAESKQVAMGKWNQKKEEKENNGDSGGKKKTQLIVYCHTPIRYYWSHYEEYKNMMEFGIWNPLAKFMLGLLIGWLRRLDYEAAQRVDVFIANSKTTQERIKKYYGRESLVIYPGIKIPSNI
jgi:Glycosyltransferase Family 4